LRVVIGVLVSQPEIDLLKQALIARCNARGIGRRVGSWDDAVLPTPVLAEPGKASDVSAEKAKLATVLCATANPVE